MEEEMNEMENSKVNEQMNSEEDEEEMMKRHRQEKKELQAKSQGLRKSVPKGDKKRKKEVTEQVLAMEMEMEQRHKVELENLAESARSSVKENPINEEKGSVNETNEHTETEKQARVSKAQKRRDKKLQKEVERNEAIAKAEVENMKGKRYIENKKISDKLEARRLQIHEIPADGSCLYFAVMDQLRQRNTKTDVQKLRKQTGEYIRANKDEFMPYLSDTNTGEPYTDAQFQKYCDDVVKTSAWGGHLELRALSDILKAPIEIVQSEVDSLMIGEDHKDETRPIILTYHRHAYRVGEHYNSVQPLREV